MTNYPTYKRLAMAVYAYQNCIKAGNETWAGKHAARIGEILSGGPSGSGIDNGTTLDMSRSTEERLVLCTSFHHMNEHGMYDGWSEHEVIVKGSLWSDIDIRVTGKDRNGIKDYLSDVFFCWLTSICED